MDWNFFISHIDGNITIAKRFLQLLKKIVQWKKKLFAKRMKNTLLGQKKSFFTMRENNMKNDVQNNLNEVDISNGSKEYCDGSNNNILMAIKR